MENGILQQEIKNTYMNWQGSPILLFWMKEMEVTRTLFIQNNLY